MTGIRSRTGKRSAFTMIELIVVILIIGILMSLVTVGVVKVTNKIPEVQTRTEISELATALQAFMTDFGLNEPPPSYLFLYENISLYNTNPAAAQSYAFLQKVFGRNLGFNQPFVDWNGDGIMSGPAPSGAAAPWILEGEQCLVFYTGGIPNTAQTNTAIASGLPPVYECQGFSANKMNPAMASGKRKGPYYTFQSSRLMPLATNVTAAQFFVYLDPWKVKNGPAGPTRANGWPYAYFSSNGINNKGYLLNSNLNDCKLIFASPYWTAQTATVPPVPTAFTNSNRYQIISAGQNGSFGGGLWVPSSGATGNGADDQANFSGGLLGTGQR